MNDAVAAPILLLTTMLLLWSASLWSRRLFPGDPVPVAITHVVVLSSACVVGNTILLGLLGIISALSLFAGVFTTCVIALVILHFTRLRSQGSVESPRDDSIPAVHTREQGTCLGTDGSKDCGLATVRVASSWLAHLPFGDSVRQPPRVARYGYSWGIAWGLLAAVAVAHVVLDGVLSFPTDPDTLAYHLPLIDHWIREGTLYVPDCAFWYCPGNNEIWGLWLLAPFSGDYLVALNNLPSVMLLAVAAFALAMSFGISPPMSHLTAMAIVGTQPTWRQMLTAENDVAVAAMFLTTLFYGVRYLRDHRRGDMILGSAALGLLAGVKYYALGYAAVAGVSVLLMLAAWRRPRDAVRAGAVGFASVLILGGYWYLRNAYVTGTPLYPKGFTESTDLWSVMRPGSHTSTLLGSGRLEVWPLLAHAVGAIAGPCQLAATLLLPATLLWLVVSPWSIPDRRNGRLRRWFALVILLSGVVLLATPNVVETEPGTMNMLRSQYHPVRFGLSVFSVAVLALAIFLDDTMRLLCDKVASVSETRAGKWHGMQNLLTSTSGALSSWPQYGIYALVTIAVGCQLVHHGPERVTLDWLVLALTVFLAGLILSNCVTSSFRHQRAFACAAILCVCPAAAWVCQALAIRWHAEFVRHYDLGYDSQVFASLASLDPARERICICDYLYYPFGGSRRQFRVSRPLWIPEFGLLLEYLRARDVTLLVTCNTDGTAHGRYASVEAWVSAHPEAFEAFYHDVRYTVVRVNYCDLADAFVSSTASTRFPKP